MKKGERSRYRFKFIERIELLSLVLFALSIFLMDNNLNIITAYGTDVTVTVFGNIETRATNMFWTGFLSSLLFFLIIVLRSYYKRQDKLTRIDIVFGILGSLGFMILLSGGLLGFWHNSSFMIPIFIWNVSRVTYYHIGIGLNLFALIYFTLTK